jgi:hypothetical protein
MAATGSSRLKSLAILGKPVQVALADVGFREAHQRLDALGVGALWVHKAGVYEVRDGEPTVQGLNLEFPLPTHRPSYGHRDASHTYRATLRHVFKGWLPLAGGRGSDGLQGVTLAATVATGEHHDPARFRNRDRDRCDRADVFDLNFLHVSLLHFLDLTKASLEFVG